MNIANSHSVRLKTEDYNQTMNAIRAFADFEAQFICYAVSGQRAKKTAKAMICRAKNFSK